MAYNICVLGNMLDPDHIAKIKTSAAQQNCSVFFYSTHDEAMPHLSQMDVIFGPSDARSPLLVRNAPNLKWFASFYAGVDPLTAPGVLGDGILLTNGSGAYGVTIAEHMIMVSLMLLRRMPEYQEFVSNRTFRSDLMIGSLYGSTVVVCGTGDIGSNFARRLRSFQPAKIIGISRSGKPVEEFDAVLPVSSLDEVICQADLLALTLPGTRQTDNLISRERIAAMKTSAILVNVGRGNCIDQDALIEALNCKKLAGAALDVFRTEPIPLEDPAWNTPNLLVTPHCSGKMTMRYTRDILVDTFCSNLERFCKGESLANLVDPELGY